MHRFARFAVGALAVLALSACGGGASTGAAATPGTAATQAASTQAAASQAGSACAKAAAAGSVAATIKDFKFDPEPIAAKVGDTVTWTNNDSTGHTATVDNQTGCDTGTISPGSTGSIMFSVAGTYTYHCSIHNSMKGTINVTG